MADSNQKFKKETVVTWNLSIKFRNAGEKNVDITKSSLKDYLDMLATLIASVCGVPKEDITTNEIKKEVLQYPIKNESLKKLN